MKIMAFNMYESKRKTCCGELEEERVKDAYWISFAFLVYKDICKREPLLVHDIKKAATSLNETALDKYRDNVYWLWHDLLDGLDAMASDEQDWIDSTLYCMRNGNTLRNLFYNLTSFAKPVGTGYT